MLGEGGQRIVDLSTREGDFDLKARAHTLRTTKIKIKGTVHSNKGIGTVIGDKLLNQRWRVPRAAPRATVKVTAPTLLQISSAFAAWAMATSRWTARRNLCATSVKKLAIWQLIVNPLEIVLRCLDLGFLDKAFRL